MTMDFTLTELLEKAIQKEIEAQTLYAELSRRVEEAAVRDALQALVRQEEGHQKLLEQYRDGKLRGGALRKGQRLDYRIVEKLDHREISADMALKDVFLLAAEREKTAHEFYLALAEIHPAGEAKKLMTDLAAQELGHKHRVEYLYTEVAFPQLDGG
ncbi:MAG: ferritin family protein [Dehalococcoidales bacterium]